MAQDVSAPVASEALWHERARKLIEYALLHWEDDEPHSYVSAADMCLRIADGFADPDELDGYLFPGEDPPELDCICPPELVARGGFKGGCPRHRA